jgi:hypothetical protein
MNREELIQMYERRYFFELELKEKLNSRIQGTFFLFTALVTISSYMIRMLDYSSSNVAVILFSIFMAATGALLSVSGWYFYTATWGNEYKALPTPNTTDNYLKLMEKHRAEIQEYNTQYPEAQQPEIDVEHEVTESVYEGLVACVSHNAKKNIQRSERSLTAIRWLFSAAAPLIIASSLFIALDMDVSSPRKTKQQAQVEQTEKINEIVSLRVAELLAQNENKELKEVPNKNTPPPPPKPAAPRPVQFRDSPSKPSNKNSISSEGVHDE